MRRWKGPAKQGSVVRTSLLVDLATKFVPTTEGSVVKTEKLVGSLTSEDCVIVEI